ncbi:hypothetical protein PG993_008559 [Apiospora rasikravindrae]|uniref:Uncharacterized protein n=1 Tax=Apiospora rasikravindrae TaxID=990691 RepID=A0ABR1T0P7_9PEZI
MDVAKIINDAAQQIGGLDFGRGRAFNKPNVVFAAFVGNHVDEVIQGMTRGQVTAALKTRLATMASHATRGHDVFTRLRGHSAFYSYIALEMNPLAPLSAADVESIFSSLEKARERAVSASQSSGNAQKSKLILALDVLLKLRQKANDLGRHNHMITLKPKTSSRPSTLRGPKNNTGVAIDNNTVWPPAHFSALDVAHLCQQDVHTALFGITPDKPGSEPTYPTEQDNPLAVRRFLCYENLTKNKAGSTTWALYCAPVAFLDDGAREKWYVNTGHSSRFYSTLPEFIAYAKDALSRDATERVICMLTPWFYEVNEVMTFSGGHVALPLVWRDMCYRSGMTLVVDKDGNLEDNKTWKFKVVIFQPQAPRYPPRRPPRRRQRREAGRVFQALAGSMHYVEGAWVGGTLKPGGDDGSGVASRRGVSPDSVELAAAMVTELTEDPQSLTTDSMTMSTRHFRNADVRQSAWDA